MLSSCQHFVIREYETHLRRDETIEGKRRDRGISINHEQILIERRVNTNDILDLMIHFQLQWVHRSVKVDLINNVRVLGKIKVVEVHLIQETHKNHLRVTLTTVTRA